VAVTGAVAACWCVRLSCELNSLEGTAAGTAVTAVPIWGAEGGHSLQVLMLAAVLMWQTCAPARIRPAALPQATP